MVLLQYFGTPKNGVYLYDSASGDILGCALAKDVQFRDKSIKNEGYSFGQIQFADDNRGKEAGDDYKCQSHPDMVLTYRLTPGAHIDGTHGTFVTDSEFNVKHFLRVK